MLLAIEAVLMGVVATLVMDLMAKRLAKMKVIHPSVSAEAVGRWILYMARGKFWHRNINETAALEYEKPVSLLFHYLIGIGLAGVYLLLEMQVSVIHDNVWMALVFGLATVVLPWFWLYPSMGFGFVASKVPVRKPYIVTSLVNHTDFGVGLLLWVVLFRRFMP